MCDRVTGKPNTITYTVYRPQKPHRHRRFVCERRSKAVKVVAPSVLLSVSLARSLSLSHPPSFLSVVVCFFRSLCCICFGKHLRFSHCFVFLFGLARLGSTVKATIRSKLKLKLMNFMNFIGSNCRR